MINMFKSGKKTFVETLFLIAPESDAEKIWSTDLKQLAKNYKSLQEKNIDDEMISWFRCLTVDELYDPGYVAKTRKFLDNNKGRGLFVLPQDFAHRLSEIDAAEAAELGEKLLNFEHFEGWKAKDLSSLLTKLASLAKDAESQKARIFVLLDASSADKVVMDNFRVRQLCVKGQDLLLEDKFSEALETFLVASEIAENSEITPVMVAAIYAAGSAYWRVGQYENAIEKLELALFEEEDNPAYIHLALGRCHLDSGNKDEAAQCFRKAYMMEGYGQFEAQEKYYQFLLSTMSELGKRAKGWNDALLLIDLHLEREFSNDPIADKVRNMCLDAVKIADSKNYPDAIAKLWEAFDVAPECAPSNDDYEDEDGEQDSFARLFIGGAIGDLNFLNKDYDAGADNLQGLGTHAFSLLRLGQCLFEMGNDEEFAVDVLARAYFCGGREIFANEDPKYLKAMSKYMRPPSGQTEL